MTGGDDYLVPFVLDRGPQDIVVDEPRIKPKNKRQADMFHQNKMARLKQELSDEEEAFSEERQIQFEKERRITEEEKKLKDKEVESLEHKIKSAKLKRELSTSFDEDNRFQRINGVM